MIFTMPLIGPVLGGQIMQKFAQKAFTGVQAIQLAMAVGNGIALGVLATNFYTGFTIGTGLGAGVGTGKVVGLVGPVVGGNIYQQCLAMTMTGTQTLNTAMAIGEAFAEHVTSLGIVISAGAPVAIGTGTGPILGIIGPVLGSSIYGLMVATGLIGTQSIKLAMAIGNGISLSMAAVVVNTSIVGIPFPIFPMPAAGVEVGKLI